MYTNGSIANGASAQDTSGNGSTTTTTRPIAPTFRLPDLRPTENVGTLLVRSVSVPLEEIRQGLAGLGVERIGLIDPAASLTLEDGSSLEQETGQRIAPAVGAAVGRS